LGAVLLSGADRAEPARALAKYADTPIFHLMARISGWTCPKQSNILLLLESPRR
jgi:hypothetical protein